MKLRYDIDPRFNQNRRALDRQLKRRHGDREGSVAQHLVGTACLRLSERGRTALTERFSRLSGANVIIAVLIYGRQVGDAHCGNMPRNRWHDQRTRTRTLSFYDGYDMDGRKPPATALTPVKGVSSNRCSTQNTGFDPYALAGFLDASKNNPLAIELAETVPL